jgi:FOG: Transposase and inactivated derivatives
MNKTKRSPARSQFNILRQICKLIPEHLVPQLARETGADDKSRTFSPWSHVVSLLNAQLTHCIGLNDLCDGLQLHSGPLSTIRGATAPSRNALSHANRHRPAVMAEQLFWKTLAHLKEQSPGFAGGKRRGPAFRFKMPIHVIDSTTLELVANSIDWAKHRRRKAAAKLHLRLNLQSLLPGLAIVDTAAEHDNKRARELCAGLNAGEIALFDKGYVDFGHLLDLDRRGVSWVTRAKENMAYDVVRKMPRSKDGGIVCDEIVQLKDADKPAPELMRRVIAVVEVDGQEQEMVFLTNNLEWSPRSVADLYRCRWQIEAFFKQIKQTLQLADFLGHNANAVRWQVWTALLAYVLLRYLSYLSKWGHSFTRLFTILRAVLWNKLDLMKLLESYGTAGGDFRHLARPEQAYFPGFA